MSVRRLAEDNVQPESFSFNKENAIWAKAAIKKYPKGREQSAVIPLLMRAQEQDGWVTKAAIESVADMLGMAYIRVLEVATFYTQFQLLPVGTRAHVQVCGTTPCMLRGAEDLINVCKKRIHPEPLHLNETGTLSWEEVECQGACVNAPMIMIFKDSYEDLTTTQLEHIIDRFDAGKGSTIAPGPQVDRVFSAPVGGLTSLNEPDAAAPKTTTRAKKAEGESVSVPPSNAAKPKTDAVETDPKLKTPATAKAEAAANTKATGDTRAEGGDAEAKQPLVADGKPSLDDKNRPAGIARPATPDDLKLISGVGPKIEGTLHDLGIFTFAQVAAWKQAERKQAEALAKGGEAEYIRVFGKKPR
jgi:NADH-quinone oxidoreductase subunit E